MQIKSLTNENTHSPIGIVTSIGWIGWPLILAGVRMGASIEFAATGCLNRSHAQHRWRWDEAQKMRRRCPTCAPDSDPRQHHPAQAQAADLQAVGTALEAVFVHLLARDVAHLGVAHAA